MSKILDKEFFKQRAKTLAEMTEAKAPDSYLIERFFVDGSFASTKIEAVSNGWKRVDTASNFDVTERELHSADSLIQVLAKELDAISIGPEITFIHSSTIGISELLEILVPIAPDIVPDESAWAKLPVAKLWHSNWHGFEEYEFKLFDLESKPIEVLPSLVVVNGTYLVTLKLGGISGYLPLDDSMEFEWPLITKKIMLDFWYTCGEGPPSWEGRTNFGEAGPNFYARITSGDLDGEIQIYAKDAAEQLSHLATINVLQTYGGLEAFLLHQIGLPDLPNNPYHEWLSADIEHEGHFFYLYLDGEAVEKVLSEIEFSASKGKFLADSLRDSSTPLGQKVYEAFPKVLETGSNWEIIELLRAAQEPISLQCE